MSGCLAKLVLQRNWFQESIIERLENVVNAAEQTMCQGGEGLKTPKDTFSKLDVMLFCSFSEVGRPKTNKKSSFPQIDIYLDKHVLFDLNWDTKAEI